MRVSALSTFDKCMELPAGKRIDQSCPVCCVGGAWDAEGSSKERCPRRGREPVQSELV